MKFIKSKDYLLTKKVIGVGFLTGETVQSHTSLGENMKTERRNLSRNPIRRTIAVYLCRDRRLDLLKIALRKILGPEAYFFRPTGGGIDMGHKNCFDRFAREIKTLHRLETGLIIALTHNDCHHCRVNNIISPGNDEICTLKQLMKLAGQNIKSDFPTMKVITGIIHTEQALLGDLQSIELIAPYNDSSFLYEGRCTEHLHHNAFHDIGI